MTRWGDWLGREEQRSDQLDENLVRRWCASFDTDMPLYGLAPQGLHWCLGVPDAPTRALDTDGHPRRDITDSLLPPVSLPRRMWASSVVNFVRPLHIGEKVARRSVLRSIDEKHGGTGALVFAKVFHETFGANGLAVSELQSIVYKEASPPGAEPVPPVVGPFSFDASVWDRVQIVTPSEVMLFRYSALTFNSHRIHYDLSYATRCEGYRGLVVHGPLVASLLLELARQTVGEQVLTEFSFRGVSPAIGGEPVHLAIAVHGTKCELGAFASDGRQIMNASGKLKK